MNPPSSRKLLSSILVGSIAALVSVHSAQAASATWNASPTNGIWEAAGVENNWSTGAATFPGALSALTNADTATFLTSGTTTISINATSSNATPLGIKNITFGAVASPSAFTIGTVGGNSLLLASTGSISIASGSSVAGATETVNAPLVLEPASGTTAGTYTFSNASALAGSILKIGGTVTGGTTTGAGAAGVITLTLTGASTTANEVSGIISNGGAAGGVAVSKTSTGTWILSGVNSFTGGVTLAASGGTLRATTSASALGAGALALNGGTLQLANDTGLNFGRATTVGGNVAIQSDRLTAASPGVTHTLGTLSIGAFTLSIAPGANATSGTAGITFGATTLSAASASFSVAASSLLTVSTIASAAGANTTLTVTGAGNTSITGIASDPTANGSVPTLSLLKSGAGTLTLSAANSFTGLTTIQGGTIALTTGANRLASGNDVTFTTGAGTLDVQQAQTLGNVTFSSGSNGSAITNSTVTAKVLTVDAITANDNATVGNANLSLATSATPGVYTWSVATGKTLSLNSTAALAAGITTARGGYVNIANSGTIASTMLNTSGILGGGWVTYGAAGSNNDWAAVSGGNVIALPAYDSIATPGANKNVLVTDNGSFTTTASYNTLKLADTTTTQSLAITSGQILTLTSGGIIFTGANDYSVTGGTLKSTLGSTNSDLIIYQNGAGKLTIGSTVANGNGATTLTKFGSGTLVLGGTAATTFTGNTYLSGGTLSYSADNTAVKGLNFGVAVGDTHVSTLDLSSVGVASNVTATSLIVQTNSSSANTITIGSTKTLAITNSTAGNIFSMDSTAGGTAKLTISGAGAMSITNATNGIFYVGPTSDQNATRTYTLDMSGLTGGFTANVSSFIVGKQINNYDNEGSATVKLAPGSSITAPTFSIGDDSGNGGNGGGGSNTVTFSSGSNSLTVSGTATIGRAKGGTQTLNFATGGGTLAMTVGTMYVGYKPHSGSTNDVIGVVNFTNGAATGTITNLYVGYQTSNGGSNTPNAIGTFTLGSSASNNLSVTNLIIGSANATGNETSAKFAQGTVTLGGGSLTAGSITMTGTTSVFGQSTLNINGGTLTVNGNINGSSGASQTLVLAGGTLDMTAGNIGDATNDIDTFTINPATAATLKNVGSINGTAGITKTGAGVLTLDGSNTYTGATAISVGTVKLGAVGAIGNGTNNTSGISVAASGAALDLNGISPTANVGLTLNGTGISTGGALTNNNATAATYGGLVALGSASSIKATTGDIILSNNGTIIGATFGLTVGGAHDTTINSIIGTTTGSLTKADAGTLTLSGVNTYSGATSITGGTLIVASGGIIGSGGGTAVTTSTSGTAFNVNNTNGLTGTSSLTVGASTTATLSTANNYSGATAVTGTLNLQNAGSIASSSGLTLNSGATLQLRNDSTTVFNTPITAITGTAAGSLTLDVNQATVAGSGQLLTLNGAATATGSNGTFTVNVTGGNTYSLSIPNFTVSNNFASAGAYTVLFNPTTANVALGTVNGVTTAGGATHDVKLILDGTSTGNTVTTLNAASGGGWMFLTKQGAGTWTVGTAAGGVNQGSIIISNGTLNVSATGTLFPNNVGTTSVNGGVLGYNNAGAVRTGTGGALVLAGGNLDNTSGAAITTSTYNPVQTWNADFSFLGTNGANSNLNLGTGAVSLGTVAGATRTVTVTNAATNLTVGGIISNGTNGTTPTINLSKAGSGTLTVSGANSYSGGTSIKNGVLALDGGTNRLLSTGSVVIGDTGTTGKLVLGGASAVSQTLAGLTTTGLGGSVVGGNASNSTLTLNVTSGTNTFDGTLGGAGANENNLALTKSGIGTLTLTGPNLYTGGTTLSQNGGAVRITDAGALGGGAVLNQTSNAATSRSTVELALPTPGSGVGSSAANPNLIANAFNFSSQNTLSAGGFANIENVSGFNRITGATTITNTGGSGANIVSDAGNLELAGAVTVGPIPTGTRVFSFGGAGNGLVSGVISNASSGNLAVTQVSKNDAGTWTLSNPNNTYTGPTNVVGGTLEISGKLSGTTQVNVNSGTLLLSNNANNIINSTSPASLTVTGSGVVANVLLDNSMSGKQQTFSNLTLSGSSTLDFGTGAAGNALIFSQSPTFTGTLAIWNWSPGSYAGGSDTGSLADGQDRLLFNGTGSGFDAGQLAAISFYSDGGLNLIGTGAQISFGSQFEIVPIPEPASTALLGSIGLLGLIGYRERFRLRGRKKCD